MRTKTMFFMAIIGAGMCGAADAAPDRGQDLKKEVLAGLDILGARVTYDTAPQDAPGELGLDVYQTAGVVDAPDMRMFVPTSMYVRMGAGMNLPFATGRAEYNGHKTRTRDSYTVQLGLGWNLSSYVRAELDFQNSGFKFKDVEKLQANYNTVGGMLYFDLLRRYTVTGDVTRQRAFVPFIGVGAAAGVYQFDGPNGADGFVVAAPRAVAGFNVRLNDLVGLDVMYQYQMMIGNGFGWNASSDVTGVSNIMASLRVNF